MERKSEKSPRYRIKKIRSYFKELQGLVGQLGSQSAVFPRLVRDIKLELKKNDKAGLNTLCNLVPKLKPFCDLTDEETQQIITELGSISRSLPQEKEYQQFENLLKQLTEYYDDKLKSGDRTAEVWAKTCERDYFLIDGQGDMSPNEIALKNLLLRHDDGRRFEKNKLQFGGGELGAWNIYHGMHVRPPRRTSNEYDISKHNSIGIWLQIFNQRYEVFTPAVRLQIEHVRVSGNQYIGSSIKLSRFCNEGVEIAIVLELMAAFKCWTDHFTKNELVALLAQLDEIDVLDLNQWPKELVEHSGCDKYNRHRIPLYYSALQKLIYQYTPEKSIEDVPQVLDKICSYSYTSLLVACLAAVPEDFTGTNVLLCPVDEQKTEFYFKVVDSKRAYFHVVVKNKTNGYHYDNLDLITMVLKKLKKPADKDFLKELCAVTAVEWLLCWGAAQYGDDLETHSTPYHSEVIPRKVSVIALIQNLVREKNFDVTNEEIVYKVHPATMYYFNQVAWPLLRDDDIGKTTNEAFAKATKFKPSYEELIIPEGALTNIDRDDRSDAVVTLSKLYFIQDKYLGQRSLYDLLKEYQHAPHDHWEQACLTFEKAMGHFLRTFVYRDFFESEQEWQQCYERYRQWLTFLVEFKATKINAQIAMSARVVMTGNIEPLKQEKPRPSDIFNNIDWSGLSDLPSVSPKKKGGKGSRRRRFSLNIFRSTSTGSIKPNTEYPVDTAVKILREASKLDFRFEHLLKIVGCQVSITDYLPGFFERANNVIELNLSKSRGVDYAIVKFISRLSKLKHLTLGETEIDEFYLAVGNEQPKLKTVTFSRCQYLKKITIKCGTLESVDLSFCQSLRYITLAHDLPYLKYLNLECCDQLTEKQIETIINRAPELETVILPRKKNVNLHNFLLNAINRGKLENKTVLPSIIKSLIGNGELNLYGVQLTKNQIERIARAIKKAKLGNLFSTVNFSGCARPRLTCMEFIASLLNVRMFVFDIQSESEGMDKTEIPLTFRNPKQAFLTVSTGNFDDQSSIVIQYKELSGEQRKWVTFINFTTCFFSNHKIDHEKKSKRITLYFKSKIDRNMYLNALKLLTEVKNKRQSELFKFHSLERVRDSLEYKKVDLDKADSGRNKKSTITF